jgi:hypothetical protein
MSKAKIKEAILESTGRPEVGWVAENADFLAEKIAEALGFTEAPKPVGTASPAAGVATNKENN